MNHRILNRSNSERAILFAVNDIPLLEPLGLYREDPEHTLHLTAPPSVPGERPGVRKPRFGTKRISRNATVSVSNVQIL